MKKLMLLLALILSLILVLISTTANAALDDVINFPDPVFEAMVRSVVGKPTEPIAQVDVAKITKLDLVGSGGTPISSLSGIEHFTALETLDCSGNQLTQLDVSKNTALTMLHCNGNQLTQLDMSKNTALKELSCCSNQLTSLDVSNNLSLEKLICFSNQLTQLDVSNNTALKELHCSSNQLIKLDVSKNMALEALRFSDNKLIELDLSKNTVLTELDCFGNQLMVLDVSNNAALEQILCHNNQLIMLDVRNNVALKTLICYENVFPDTSAIVGLDENRLVQFQFIPQKTPGLSAPDLSTAANWAWVEIISAVKKGFVPEDLQDNYYNVITRQEFCRMAVMFVEYALDEDIDVVLADQNISRDPDAFSDTTDSYILAAYSLGITNGTKAPTDLEPGLFTPEGQFSRQEAATMLMRVCSVIGMDTSDPAVSDFVDLHEADSWAHEGINFVRANGIMGGTNVTKPTFSPHGTFTRQESIVTFDRIL